jgi:hypothetical protein
VEVTKAILAGIWETASRGMRVWEHKMVGIFSRKRRARRELLREEQGKIFPAREA